MFSAFTTSDVVDNLTSLATLADDGLPVLDLFLRFRKVHPEAQWNVLYADHSSETRCSPDEFGSSAGPNFGRALVELRFSGHRLTHVGRASGSCASQDMRCAALKALGHMLLMQLSELDAPEQIDRDMRDPFI